jgi:pimeloyl-ACP methyl ester carboxylesterase
LPDTGNEARAAAEAQKLAKLGVTAMVVNSPANVPTQAVAFEQAVAAAAAAVDTLRKRPGIDPLRVGLVGEGVGAHVGAVTMGRAPRTVAAAVLADIGGVVVPSKAFAPEHWLERAQGTDLLFQRHLAKRGMTTAEVQRLILASPPGTLMEQYKQLGASAETSRDKWIRDHLVAR